MLNNSTGKRSHSLHLVRYMYLYGLRSSSKVLSKNFLTPISFYDESSKSCENHCGRNLLLNVNPLNIWFSAKI